MSKAIETTAERRARQAVEGAQAMKEYQANANATRLRTEKLRAARLAHEAAASEAPPPAPAKRRAAKAVAAR